jgi:V8-like Glu-specific endopeptidase
MGEIKPSIYHATKDANLEKILGSNNLLKISWLERAILKSKSVCQIRLINNDRAIGTGFVLKGGYLMTNCHVIPNKSAVDNVKIIFDFEEDLLGQVRKTFEYRLDKNDATFSPIAELDYAYIKIIDNPANPLAQWGHLEIEITVPQVDDAVTIIQHPLGQVKQIALTANEVIGINDQKLLYKTDTERGSSGSPVFNNHWKVIALHHAGKTEEDGGLVINPVTGERRGANEGILMNKIAQKLTIVVNP